MRKTTYQRIVLGYLVTAEITRLNDGFHILLVGGSRTHVGAVSTCSGSEVLTIEEKHHREGVVSAKWADTLHRAWNCPVTVACGIHYDHASKEEIRIVVEETDIMLAEIRSDGNRSDGNRNGGNKE